MTDSTQQHDERRPAGGSRVDRGEARWYCVSREGMATLCTCEEDAKIEAANAQQNYPLNGPYRAVQMVDSARVTDLLAALQFYAAREHFILSDDNAWDTVSCEPQNWWCDEAGTATVEDGSLAAMTLRGELTAAQIQALD
jgi:hypothetical protein